MIKTNRGGAAHLAKLAWGKEDSLGHRGGRAGRCKGRTRAASEKSFSAIRAQVFAGSVEVPQFRWMFDATHVNATAAKLLPVKRRTFRGQPQCPSEAGALNFGKRPRRRSVQETHGPVRLHMYYHALNLLHHAI